MTQQHRPRRTITEKVTLERTIEVPWEYHEFDFVFTPGALAPITTSRSTPTPREHERAQVAFWNGAQAALQRDLHEWYEAGFVPEDNLGPHLVEVRIRREQQMPSTWKLVLGVVAAFVLLLARQDVVALLVGMAVALWLLVRAVQASFGQVLIEPAAIRVWMARPCMEGHEATVAVDSWPAAPAAGDSNANIDRSDRTRTPIRFPAPSQRELGPPSEEKMNTFPRRRAQ